MFFFSLEVITLLVSQLSEMLKYWAYITISLGGQAASKRLPWMALIGKGKKEEP